MRTTALVLILALAAALAHGAAAQPTFTQPYQLRAAVGDIPTTEAPEPAAAWNVEQRLAVDVDPAAPEGERTYRFPLPAGATLLNASCDCAFTRSVSGGVATLTVVPPTTAGQHTLRVTSTQPAGDVLGFRLALPEPVASVVVLYVPNGSDVASNVDLSEVGPSTGGNAVIHYAAFDGAGDIPADTWFAIHPATDAAQPEPASDGSGLGSWLIPLLAGLVLGVILWALLVSKGVVQAKSRKQVVATAAHVEAAATDPPAVLEGKKRALLAALKEVELAKQANEMPVEVYDAVKADLKKQAVTVMRALETGGQSKS